jgi:hypothetical protein
MAELGLSTVAYKQAALNAIAYLMKVSKISYTRVSTKFRICASSDIVRNSLC